MKYFFLVTLFFPLLLVAQEPTTIGCKLSKEKDPFTKEVKLSTGFIPMDSGSVTIDANKLEIDFLFYIDGAGKCFDNNSTAYVYFEGTRQKLSARNGGTMNCEGLFHFIFRNTASLPSMLTKMASQKVNRIVFTGNNKKESTINFSPANQELFMTLTNCLINEAKELIPK